MYRNFNRFADGLQESGGRRNPADGQFCAKLQAISPGRFSHPG
jgi:hypothetical protein